MKNIFSTARSDGLGTPPSTQSERAFDDISEGLRRWELWVVMGWNDIRQQYRRSILGPLWLTLSMAIMTVTIGLLYGSLFDLSVRHYLPYLAVGLVVWAFISGSLNGGCTMFTGASSHIREVRAPISTYIFRLTWFNLIILAHNALVFIVAIVAFGSWPGLTALLVIPGLVLLALNCLWMSVVLGMLTVRFRDIPSLVGSLVQIAFFLTPILWKVEQIDDKHALIAANPFIYLLNIVRQPLLGETPSALSWVVALGMACAGILLASWMFIRYRSRIAYWL